MKHYSIFLPSYTIGTDAYEEMGVICRPYGTQAVVIGGKRAMEAAREELTAAAAKGAIQILDFVWFGGECSFKNVEVLENNPKVREAELLFAVGGGKATDTVKALGEKTGKPVFAFRPLPPIVLPVPAFPLCTTRMEAFLSPGSSGNRRRIPLSIWELSPGRRRFTCGRELEIPTQVF